MNAACTILVVCLAGVPAWAADYTASDFATTLVEYGGLLGGNPYDDPHAVLGKPATWVKDSPTRIMACSLVFPAWNKAPDGTKVVVTLDDTGYVVAGFDHKVADDPGNAYGIDFIVYGNAKFTGIGWVEPNTPMDTYILTNPASVNSEPVTVSVAQYPQGPWYTFASPSADGLFPTQAFAWTPSGWGEEMDWLKPVNPALTKADFSGLTAAQAITRYDGSAGGTGYDLRNLSQANYAALEADPATGRKWIQYVKFTSQSLGEVDAVSDVAACGDYRHSPPAGDLNGDCIVDLGDIIMISQSWLSGTAGGETTTNLNDFAAMAAHWTECTWKCE